MLEVVYGQSKNATVANELIAKLKEMRVEGTLYLGYPILASVDDSVTVDALLASEQLGLVVFILGGAVPAPRRAADVQRIRDEQDALYYSVRNNLGRHPSLRRGRELAIPVEVVTLLPAAVPAEIAASDLKAAPISAIEAILANATAVPSAFWRPVNAALQRVMTIKPRKRRAKATTNGSRGSILKEIEKEIANLDQWQKQAAIESPEGPQRIRGLAGSGKTIVLALKAAYLHTQNPDWDIAVTFYSRALHQQFKELIQRFCVEHTNDEPNWDKLRILHSWGGRDRPGVYAEMAHAAGVVARDFSYGKGVYGMDKAFQGICKELLAATSASPPTPIYDAVLIDEGQDLPREFFRLVRQFLRPPHRVVWAYDELQNLSDTATPSTAELFGTDSEGRPLVVLRNEDGTPRQDVILPVCYRNTPWALTLAHALGFGIYRDELVQHFDDPKLWEDIGYEVERGTLALGSKVTLKRRKSSYPEYFTKLVKPDDAVAVLAFDNEIDQAAWVAQSIKTNLSKDELDHDDVLIVLPSAYTARTSSARVIDALAALGIDAHLAGATTSADQLFIPESIAIAQIYRAKGNEAPMVYFLNADECQSGYELIKLRNILFTGITRSRAWVRLCGTGSGMPKLVSEINKVISNQYMLKFAIPTKAELEKLRTIHRDLTPMERSRAKRAERAGSEFVKAIEEGDVDFENLPEHLRESLLKLAKKSTKGRDDAERD